MSLLSSISYLLNTLETWFILMLVRCSHCFNCTLTLDALIYNWKQLQMCFLSHIVRGFSHGGRLARLARLAHLKTLHCNWFWRIKKLEIDHVTSKNISSLANRASPPPCERPLRLSRLKASFFILQIQVYIAFPFSPFWVRFV